LKNVREKEAKIKEFFYGINNKIFYSINKTCKKKCENKISG